MKPLLYTNNVHIKIKRQICLYNHLERSRQMSGSVGWVLCRLSLSVVPVHYTSKCVCVNVWVCHLCPLWLGALQQPVTPQPTQEATFMEPSRRAPSGGAGWSDRGRAGGKLLTGSRHNPTVGGAVEDNCKTGLSGRFVFNGTPAPAKGQPYVTSHRYQ